MTTQTIINFFGTGVRYWICRVPNDEFDKLRGYKEKHNLVWESIFFNLDVLEKFGYKDWESIHLLEEGTGWIPVGKNWIEIRIGRKKRKFSSDEFLGAGLMFDSFNKDVSDFELTPSNESQDILLLQIETGLIAKYVVNESISDLAFLTCTISPNWMSELFDLAWVEGLKYKGRMVEKSQDDTVIRESKVKIIG